MRLSLRANGAAGSTVNAWGGDGVALRSHVGPAQAAGHAGGAGAWGAGGACAGDGPISF
jgi:hypothetical protein